MQFFARLCVAAACAAFASSASAEVRVSVKRTNYDIAGTTGVALLQAMDRKGPKHGFLTRAIAQTGYTVGWEIEWAMANGNCRVKKATADLAINYTFPRLTGRVSRDMKRRWTKFMQGVEKHEETHGAIAKKMVRVAERALSGFSMQNDRNCSRSKREVKRRVDAIYAEYEARQVRFDAREHRDGGRVEGLVAALIRNR